MGGSDWDRLKLDYEETTRQFRSFADVRFKLLAIVPALLGAGLFGLFSLDGGWGLEVHQAHAFRSRRR